MLTLFSVPKSFDSHIGIIQRNALESWARLHPDIQIILFGDEKDVAHEAQRIGATHIPKVECNQWGTPLLSDVFNKAKKIASHHLLCYVNTDIILLQSFTSSIKRVTCKNFVIVGQRWDLDVTEGLDFSNENWQHLLEERTRLTGHLHPPAGSDYFVFPRESKLTTLPPFAVGRPGWDNWFLYKTRSLRIPLIDATSSATVIHQNHDYSHVKERQGDSWDGPEADINRQLVGGSEYMFTLIDATHRLTKKGLQPALSYENLLRRRQTLTLLSPVAKRLKLLRDKITGK